MRAPLFVCLLLMAGCNDGTEVSVSFAGLVGDADAECGGLYAPVGTTGTELELEDLRLYVHDVRLLDADGAEVPVTLDPESPYQHEGVAYLDFEDGSSACESGNEALNSTLSGTVDAAGPFTGIRFRLGVPFELNHADVSTAPAPLNIPGMFWNWNGGYKFLRIDGRTTGLPGGWRVHVGSTGCDGDGRGNVTACTGENRPEIELTGFDPTAGEIAVDVAALVSDSDLDSDAGGMPGCMSGPGDTECEPIFHALGLPFEGSAPTGPQRFFRVR